MNLFKYLWTIIKINYVVLGGASLTTPFYYKYFVDTNIIPEQEINHYLTMGNILPGAMSFYMSAYTGLYLFGYIGAILSLAVLIIPITIIAIITLEFASYLPFDLNLLIYVSLPIMIIACIEFLMKIFKSNLDPRAKYGIFLLSFILLSLSIIGSIKLILIYIFIVFIISRKGKNALISAN